MIRRVRLIYNDKDKTIKARQLPLKDWVKLKVDERIGDLVFVSEFSAIYCRNLEKGVYVVYAHTHRDAQKALRKYFVNPLTLEAS